MDFFLRHYQHSLDAFQQILWMINALIHLLFAGAVAKDCGVLAKRGIKPILVSPSTWAFTTLIGGVWVAALYWLLHHSTLTRPFSIATQESQQ
jgi:hypothetical protein